MTKGTKTGDVVRYLQPRTDSDKEWQLSAACLEWDQFGLWPLDPWYADRDTEPDLIQYARKVCATCPVWRECLDDAWGTPHSWRIGIRAGLTPSERIGAVKHRHPDLTPQEAVRRRARQRMDGVL